MTDYFGRDIKAGDLVAVASVSWLDIVVVKKCSNSQFHYYNLNDYGISQSKNLSNISFINSVYAKRFLKIDPSILDDEDRKFYDAIMLNIKGNVTSANNT